MDAHAEQITGRLLAKTGVHSIRATIAYSVLMLGLAGTLAIAPLAVWMLATRGFH